MDNRDIGLSTKTEGPVPTRAALFKGFAHRRYARAEYLLSDMAADAVALLDHLGVGAAHVVGVSMGGMIAQQLTIDHPERVLSLCSIMSNTGNRRHGSVSPRLLPTVAMSMSAPRPEDPAEAERLAVEGFRLIAGPHFDADEIRGMVRTAISRNVNPLGTIRQLVAIQASPDRTAALHEVRVPTLVIHGLRDQLVMPSGGIATARAVPGSRLVAFPDMAHDLPGPAPGRDRRGDRPQRRPGVRGGVAGVRTGPPCAPTPRSRSPGRGPASVGIGAGLRPGQGVGDGVDEQPDLVLGDHQRRRDPDGRPVGVLGEDAAAHQPLAQLAAAGAAGLDVEAGPEAADPHGGEAVAAGPPDEGREPVGEQPAELGARGAGSRPRRAW